MRPTRMTLSRWLLPLIATMMALPATAEALRSAAPIPCEAFRNVPAYRAQQRDLIDALGRRNVTKIELQFTNALTTYARGETSDTELSYLVSAFQTGNVAFTPYIAEWLKLHPNSYAANMAAAAHFYELAFQLRGQKLGSETSNDQQQAFLSTVNESRRYVTRAMALSRRPITAFEYAIRLAGAVETREAVIDLYRQALALDPQALSTRNAYIWAMDRRWQGRPDDLAQYAEETRNSALDDNAKTYVLYMIELRLGGAAWTDKDKAAAAQHYRAAASLCSQSEPWRQLANLYNEFKDWPAAIESLNTYLLIEPDQSWAIRRKAWAYRSVGDWTSAIPLYRQAAELGDDNAQATMGWILMNGEHAPQDLDAAIRWLRAAAQHNNDDARRYLDEALQRRYASSTKSGH